MASHPEDEEYAREGEEQRGHDDAGIGEALKLGRHHDVDEQDDEDAEHEEVGEGVLLVFIRSGELDGDTGREVHLVDEDLGLGDDLAHRDAVDHRRHRHKALAVLTLDCRGSEPLHHLAELLDAHLASGRGSHYNVLEVFEGGTVLLVEHHLDVVFLAIFTILRGSGAVDAVAEHLGYRSEVEAVEAQFLAVEVYLIFRLIVAARDHHVGGALDAHKRLLEHACHGVGGCEVVAVDLEVHNRLATHA